MKIRFLLLGTSLSLIPQILNAQCVATQDCADLGYTEASCSGGSGVKCPFGNKWACCKSEAEICNNLGFTLSCTGTNQTGGSGKVCNGKYSECTCSSGFTWSSSSQTCEYDYQSNCQIGALYYSDGTCSPDKLSSKTLLGVVIHEKTATENGWIMTIAPVKTGTYFGGWDIDIPELTNYSSASDLSDIQSSCINTDIITAKGNSSTYPAAWAAKNYNPSGTPSGKGWCLPSGGLLNQALTDTVNFAKVNTGLIIAGEKSLENYVSVISSSEFDGIWVWVFDPKKNGAPNMDTHNKGSISADTVRPVMAF